MSVCLLVLATAALAITLCGFDEKVLFDLGSSKGPPPAEPDGAEVAVIPAPSGDGQAVQVTFEQAGSPGVLFPAADVWDWSDYTGLAVDATNPGSQWLSVYLRVDNAGADPARRLNCNATLVQLRPGQKAAIVVRFHTGEEKSLWGMREYPFVEGYPMGPLPMGTVIDPSKVTGFGVTAHKPAQGERLIMENVRLWREPPSAQESVRPFVDEFGQYIQQDWPGKVKSEHDLVVQREAELLELDDATATLGRDEYGGWAAGPQLEATGWFRTEQVDGKWWLVTPSGHLFFSTGIDCVVIWYPTFIASREDYFAWLPDRDGPFKDCYGFQQRSHSHAEPLKDTGGETFNFYQANLMRKYGDDWFGRWKDTTYRRMRVWGFNTIADWGAEDVYRSSPIPFTAVVRVPNNHRHVEGSEGYWGRIHDPYDPDFERDVNEGMAEAGRLYAGNPLCIGYFIDNELAWGGDERCEVAVGTLASPPDQLCRRAFMKTLEAKHGNLASLNDAWGAQAESWDDLRAPAEINAACREDLHAFVYEFSLRYFETVRDAVRKHAPNQLYLGVRFAWRNKLSVKACAEIADVVSFNIYTWHLTAEKWGWTSDLGKPCIIGEFHSGATDRGCLHPGLVIVKDQAERAQTYMDYVNSVADLPAFVGCHWFQYMDEPLTGRAGDGENYNVGLVSVADTPYPELLEAARKTHEGVYERRYGGAAD
ncbi:MAG: beta-galactosidase [Planctomycetota bacterium]|jgi:hypothetical protein